jgi:hypothetical protein
MKNFTFLFCCLFVFSLCSHAQLSQGGTPKSFTMSGLHSVVPAVHVGKPDLDKVLAQDKINDAMNKAYRVGTVQTVSINPDNSGVWDFLPDGSAIWRVKVASEEALAQCLYFSDYQLLPGMELFVYSTDKSFVLGAFTEVNNHESRLMATQHIPGSELIMELFMPDRHADFGYEINGIGYFYRGIVKNKAKSSGACEVNVACSEGDNWTNERQSVVKIQGLMNGDIFSCTGSLMNSTAQDCKPYFLTADHCSAMGSIEATSAELNQWVFEFNYQAATCDGTTATSQSLTGCTYKASDTFAATMTGPDFFLCLLNNDVPASYNPYFNGWSFTAPVTGSSGVSIHHPLEDIKKVSTYLNLYGMTTDNIEISWSTTANGHGVMEPGSSGAPLYDENKKVIGTFSNGFSSCADSLELDFFGRFSRQWTYNTATDKQLKHWLDSAGISTGTLDGRGVCTTGLDNVQYIRANIHVYPNPATDFLRVDFSDYNIENGKIILTDILGETVSEPVSGSFNGTENIDVHALNPGLYFMMIQSENTSVSMPFVIE